jgi:hypothetical protein
VSEQPDALRLADELEVFAAHGGGAMDRRAAAELRRLHAVNAELLEALRTALDASWNGPMPDYARDQARAAIAKAEGVQP